MKNKGNLYIVITAVLWSTSGLLIKFVPWNAFALNGARGLLAFLVFATYRRSFKIKLSKTVFAAGLCVAATTALFALANKLTTSANAIILQDLAPSFVLIWDCIYRKQAPKPAKVVITLISFGGMVLFFFDKLGAGNLLGNIIAVMSGLTFSGVFFFNTLPESNSEDACMLGCILAAIAGIPFVGSCTVLDTLGIVSILALGIFQMGLSYIIFSKGAKLTTSVAASLISLLEAVLNPVWVFIFLGETISTFALIGGCVILGSVVAGILYSAKTEKAEADMLVQNAP